MAEPLARVFIGVRVIGRLVHDFNLHFTDAHARTRVIWDVEVASEGAQLLKLHLINYCAPLVGHRQF